MDWKDELHNLDRLPDQKTIERTIKKMVMVGILQKVGEEMDGTPIYSPNRKFVSDLDKITDKNWKWVWKKWSLERAFKAEIETDYKKLKRTYKKLKKDDIKKHLLYDLMLIRKEQKKDLSYIG